MPTPRVQAAAEGARTTTLNRDAIDRMESAMIDARIFALLMRTVVDANLETRVHYRDTGCILLSDDEVEQITFLSLRLEHVTTMAAKAYDEATGDKGAAQ